MKSEIAIALVVAGVASGHADAHIYHYIFGMNAHSVVDPTDSTAKGTAYFNYNHHTFNYDLDIRITGIALDDLIPAGPNGTPLQIYHAPRGQNGDVVLDPCLFGDFFQDGEDIRLTVNTLRLGGQQGDFESNIFANETALYEGDLYLQIFTKQYPTGEIRGQIPQYGRFLGTHGFRGQAGLDGSPVRAKIPAPASAALLFAAGVVGARRRRG